MALRISLTNLSLLWVILFAFICVLCLQLLQTQHHTIRFKSAYVHVQPQYNAEDLTKTNTADRFDRSAMNATDTLERSKPSSAYSSKSFFKEVNQYKYRPNRDFTFHLLETTLAKYANGASKSKGKYVAYAPVGAIVDPRPLNNTKGQFSMYRYEHDTPLCYRHYISLKYTPECGLDDQLDLKYVKPLLIVAVQRSGTHYMWEMLQRLQIDVHHEGVGPDGAVSWLYAVNAHANHSADVYEFGKGYAINNPEVLYKNRFRQILHQVRHPLRVITTLCKRCSEYDIFWTWIHNLKGFQQIKQDQTPLRRAMLLYLLWNKHIEKYADIRYQVEVTSPRDVCMWAGFPASQCVLHYTAHNPPVAGNNTSSTTRSDGGSVPAKGEPDAQYYSYSAYSGVSSSVSNNRHQSVEVMANRRSLTNNAHSTNAPYHVTDNNSVDTRYHSAQSGTAVADRENMRVVTWADLDDEDLALANELRVMCLEYGYSLDPQLTPQRDETRQFSA